MKLNTEKITKKSRFWQQINSLAKEAFPPEEYLAPDKLVEMSLADNFDFLALMDSDTFIGFMVVQIINSESGKQLTCRLYRYRHCLHE